MTIASTSVSSFTVGVALAGLCAGCAAPVRPLMPTPSLYTGVDAEPLFRDLPESRRVPWVDLLYVTDREPETGDKDGLPYGQRRARALAYGSAIVEMGPDLTWEKVAEQSLLEVRTVDVNLSLGEVTELGRFPAAPYTVVPSGNGSVQSPAVLEQHAAARSGFQAELSRRLASVDSKKVVVYVHGFNETFATAAATAAELCHFFGRDQVFVLFTWPASVSGNFLTSYTTTTESAEYSVPDLKKTIRMIARTPGVESLELLAHSRGTALLTDAARELLIEAVAAGKKPAEVLAVDNIVLMSPDLDVEVTGQKLSTLGSDPDRFSASDDAVIPRGLREGMTIYSSPSDRALKASVILFRSRFRLGRLRSDDIPMEMQERIAGNRALDFVIYDGEATDSYGHAYFVTNPMVSSDLIQMIRYNRKLGEGERTPRQVGPIVWEFPFYDVSSKKPRTTSRLRRERRTRPVDGYRSMTYGTGR